MAAHNVPSLGFQIVLDTLRDRIVRTPGDTNYRNHYWFALIYLELGPTLLFNPKSQEAVDIGIGSLAAYIIWLYPSEIVAGVMTRIKGKLSLNEKIQIMNDNYRRAREIINRFCSFVQNLNIFVNGDKYNIIRLHHPAAPKLIRGITDVGDFKMDGMQAKAMAKDYNRGRSKSYLKKHLENERDYSEDYKVDPGYVQDLKDTIDGAKRHLDRPDPNAGALDPPRDGGK